MKNNLGKHFIEYLDNSSYLPIMLGPIMLTIHWFMSCVQRFEIADTTIQTWKHIGHTEVWLAAVYITLYIKTTNATVRIMINRQLMKSNN